MLVKCVMFWIIIGTEIVLCEAHCKTEVHSWTV